MATPRGRSGARLGSGRTGFVTTLARPAACARRSVDALSAASQSRSGRRSLRGLARGECFRAIGKAIGRDHTTISREVNRNGGRTSYRAERADETAWGRARRPKPAKLHLNPKLRAVVEEKLCLKWSPEQISRWLRRAYPDDSDMQVSHETIYLSLFVQGRGALRRELSACLRSGRRTRHPRAQRPKRQGQGKIPGRVMISERPAEVEDRAVPGHWEGTSCWARSRPGSRLWSSALLATASSSPCPTASPPRRFVTRWSRASDSCRPSFAARSLGTRVAR